MSNIELIIKIPKEQYNAIKSDLYNTFSAEMKIWGLGAIRNGTPIPDNATNGDMIKAIFPNIDIEQIEDIIDVYGMSKCRVTYDTDWWNAPYKTESENKEWQEKKEKKQSNY